MACWPVIDTKYDPDVLVIDLNPPHEGTDKVALGGPIGLVQPVTDQACEGRKRRAGSTLSLARGVCDTRPRMAGGPAQRGCGWLYD